MAYSHTSYVQLRQALAARNNDAGNVYFSDAENGLYIKEALRQWQAMTGFSRIRATFTASANTSFYDLSSVLKASGTTVLGYNVTDQQMVNLIQYQLLEAVNNWASSTVWNGSGMFTMALVVGALQRRRDQFLADTGCVLTQSTVNIPSAPIGRVPLSDSVIAVRRAAWATPSAAAATTYSPLWQQDAWAANAFAPGWSTNPDGPLSFSVIEDQPLEVQMIPPPSVTGQLDIVSVNAGAALNVVNGVLLGVPDNWSWVPKWGALADLLFQDGESQDVPRATYCQQRYEEGVAMCREAQVILQAQIQGNPVFVDSLTNFDAFNPGWQLNTGPLTAIAAGGLNLVALGPVPDSSGPYSVVMDVAQNAPVPVNDADQIQIGREDLDAILGLAQHISLWKEGYASVKDSLPLYTDFQMHAARYNARVMAQSRFLSGIYRQSQKEKTSRPYEEELVI